MKKISLLLAGVFTLVISSQAQYEQAARKILDNMSEKYRTIHSFTADISYTLENEDFSDSFSAEIGMKGDAFRLTAENQEIIINNNTSWTYLTDENEVNISDYDPDIEDVSPSNIYNLYKSGYKYMVFGEETLKGKACNVVDLSPEEKDSDYFRIRLYIGKTDSILRKFVMYEKSGNRYIYDITNFNSNVNLPDSFFIFDVSQYKDIIVTDLRIGN